MPLSYPPAVFAVNDTNQTWFMSATDDVWIIDTEKLPNKWWHDLNNSYDRKDLIMTFEAIPPEFIKLKKL